MLNVIHLIIMSNFAGLFLHKMNKEAQEEKKKSLHFPACPGAWHACDVTISIYTATGKNFFLHCYIVTNGAGAKRGETNASSSRFNILQQFDTKRKKKET